MDVSAFENRLKKVYRHHSRWARREGISCFRFYDHDLPEAPFVIEYLGRSVHAAEYKRRHGMDEEEHEAWLVACRESISRVTEIPSASIFMKERQRKAGRQGQYEKFDAQKTEKIVDEGGLSFILNLTDYLDTGLFLDHRITRGMVRNEAAGKRVLNLFCYTGSFSVYAAAGGAKTVTSVDMSRTYIHWAKRNMQYNKLFREETMDFVQEDVLQVIEGLNKEAFDLIICDPPTFSNSKRMDGTWDVQRDHVSLMKRLLRALSDDGTIYFSNNYRGFAMDRDAIPATTVEDITVLTTPPDFKGKLQRACFRIRK